MNRTASFIYGLTFSTAALTGSGSGMDYKATVTGYTLPSIQRGLDTRVVYVNGRWVPIDCDEYESLAETASILNDSKAMAALAKGAAEIAQGKGIPWQKAKAKLGL